MQNGLNSRSDFSFDDHFQEVVLMCVISEREILQIFPFFFGAVCFFFWLIFNLIAGELVNNENVIDSAAVQCRY